MKPARFGRRKPHGSHQGSTSRPPADDRPVFDAILPSIFENPAGHSREFTLDREGPPPIEVGIDAAPADTGRGCRTVFRVPAGPRQAAIDHPDFGS